MPQATFGGNALNGYPFTFKGTRSETIYNDFTAPLQSRPESYWPRLDPEGPGPLPMVNNFVGTSSAASSNNFQSIDYSNTVTQDWSTPAYMNSAYMHANTYAPENLYHYPASVLNTAPVDPRMNNMYATHTQDQCNYPDSGFEYPPTVPSYSSEDAWFEDFNGGYPAIPGTSDNLRVEIFDYSSLFVDRNLHTTSTSSPRSAAAAVGDDNSQWLSSEEDAEISRGSAPPPSKRQRTEQREDSEVTDTLKPYKQTSDGLWRCMWANGCQKTFKRLQDLKRHQRRKDHAGPQVSCAEWKCLCGKNKLFRGNDAAKRHCISIYQKAKIPIPALLESKTKQN